MDKAKLPIAISTVTGEQSDGQLYIPAVVMSRRLSRDNRHLLAVLSIGLDVQMKVKIIFLSG